MDTFSQALRYIFVLSVILVLVAYWAGTRGVADAFGNQLNQLILTATGRTSQGTFAAYPTGGPNISNP